MDPRKVARFLAIAPLAMSLVALLDVAVVVSTGWERTLKDEGAAAHLFQLLVVLQIPLILAFLATADWKRFARAAPLAALQVGGLALAVGAVAFFKL